MAVVPPASAVLAAERDALDYLDVKTVRVARKVTALEAWVLASSRPSPFLRAAFTIRDAVAGPLGLGWLGGFSGRMPDHPAVGDRLDFFTIEGIEEDRLVLAVRERHFHVIACITVVALDVTVTTSVSVRSPLGRLYMLPVGIGHHWVLADMLARLRQGAQDRRTIRTADPQI